MLEEKIQKQFLQKIEKKVGEKNMSRLIETLRKETMEKQMKQGREESQRKIAKNMIHLKVDEEIILANFFNFSLFSIVLIIVSKFSRSSS